jgi:hypothetical protein
VEAARCGRQTGSAVVDNRAAATAEFLLTGGRG